MYCRLDGWNLRFGGNGDAVWRGTNSETINESDLAASIWKRFVYFNGTMVARRDSDTQKIYFFYSDHLGSMGVVTDQLGQTILNESDYYPYGGERVITSSLSDEHYKFTGKERDAESGLDDFEARYYASMMGRFMTPDDGSDQSAEDPQSWNLYSYVRNNPVINIDPTGRACIQSTDAERTLGRWHDDFSLPGESCAEVAAANRRDLEDAARENAQMAADREMREMQWRQLYRRTEGINDESGSILAGIAGGKVADFALGRLAGLFSGAARAVEQTGYAVEEIVAKAGSSVGNQSIKASSRAAAEEAAEKWVGAGARPIMREGEQVGFVSADGTKVARWTSAGKPDPYIN